jgi:hypothetical protein
MAIKNIDPSSFSFNMDGDGDGDEDHRSDTDVSSKADDQHASSNADEQHAIAKRETNVVNSFRVVVLVVLAASMAAVGYAVYRFLSSSEKAEFEDNFHADANKVFESIGKSLDVTIGAVDALVVSMVSFARYSNSSWPFVTLPGKQTRQASQRILLKKLPS